jgi:hypothetical protein
VQSRLALLVDGPLFVVRAGLTLFRIYCVLAVAVTSIAMTVLLVALALDALFGIRWGW